MAFLVLNGGTVAGALLVAHGVGGGKRVSLFVLCALSAWLVIVHTAVLVTGLLGWLTVGGLLTALAAMLVAAWWIARRTEAGRAPDSPPTSGTPAVFFAPLVAVAVGVIWAWPHLFDATRLWVWDDYTYHMVYPALWLRDHAIVAVAPGHAFTMQAWYPLSASVVATWFMVPFAESRADALAWVSLTALVYGGIVASASAELLARLGCQRGAWALPVILFVTSSRVGILASNFSDADLAHAAMLFGALVFAIPRHDGDELGGDAAFAALLSGLAIGVKISALPVALIIMAMLILRAGVRRARVRVALACAIGWAATGGYWYARNLIHAGNPLYPAAFLFWPGATFPQTTLKEYGQRYGLARLVNDTLTVYLNWPAFHATLALLGFAGLAVWLVAGGRAMTRSRRYFAGGAVAIAAVVTTLLPATPFSAGNGMTFTSGLIHWDSMRYVALLPLLGWAALGFLVDTGLPRWPGIMASAVTTACVLAAGYSLRTSLPLLVGALVLAVTLASLPLPRLAPRRRVVAVAAAVVAVGMMIAVSHGRKAAVTEALLHEEGLFGAAAGVLDRQRPGTRITVFGDQSIYPTFGARHHLVPVRLDRDGRVAPALIGDGMEPGDLTVHPLTFRANLAASRIGLVVVVHLPHPGRSPEWPTQASALESIGDARVLFRNAWLGIWKLGD